MRVAANQSLHIFALLFLLILVSSCGRSVVQTGRASYYADKFVGRKTANGEIFRQRKRTAAHQTLPFGTRVKVKNLSNGRTVKVRINDRGPFAGGRIIDLSKKAARKLGMVQKGVENVRLKYKKRKAGSLIFSLVF
ncbi:septal ring lytic transglycosylase RlpA family protein [Segetibacter sp. 3557_3]|uniref:septal ring lytic transglycosylase RlpA family protein n=1 Tax=Segetibacter sp. 3557_3 TaxID=2547429 RepID=UPI001058C828|nr:septal ring lytic transglycosylase RlpA family protein [Segetibacter sp. 3557_3]TDH25273.1 septal ring lytic transglycosylase RlpA family protein [Segetibacter sp. 3557_3]